MRHNLFLFTALFLTITFFLSSISQSHAQTISSIGGASVEKGLLQAETRFGYSLDQDSASNDNRLRLRQHLDYGVTDNYAARLIVAQDNRGNDSFEHDSITFENRFHLLRKEDIGFDLGMRAFYTLKDGDKKPDVAGLRFVQVFAHDTWQLRFNEFFRHEMGANARSGVSAELRTQITKKIDTGQRVGIDSFNRFGKIRDLSGYSNQQHHIGPVVKGSMHGLTYEAGYLAGISENSFDHGFKLFIGKKF